MRLQRRKHGSQRAKAPIKLKLHPNFVGSGGDATITFKGEDGVWYTLEPETEADVKALLSQVHIVHHNWEGHR